MQTLFFKYLRRIIPFFLLFFSFFLPPAHATTQKNILILPLDLHAEEEFSYIKQGISDMLASRLAQEDTIEIIPKDVAAEAVAGTTSPVTEKSALGLGQKLAADYVVYGSVTLFGESISTDARLLDTASGQTTVRFSRTGPNRSELINHIDAFAALIKAEVGGPGNEDIQQPPEQPSAALKTPVPPIPTAPTKRMISRKFGMEIRAVATGDVTGDKRREIIFIDQNNIFIYRADEKGLQRIGEIKEKNHNNFLSLEAVDTNGNGRAELFVTNLPYSSDLLQSFVVEYDNGRYRRIADNQRFFFRTLQRPDGTKRLIGQKYNHAINTLGINELYDGGVFELKWEKGSYAPAGNIALPRGSNIFNFAKGDVFKNSSQSTLQYSTSNVLRVFNANGKEEWSGEESFGSRAAYLELPDSQKAKIIDRHYLPTRIIPADFNEDGQLDVFVIRNKESVSSISRVKLFKNGQIVCLSWDGLNFQALWQSETVSKHISDFALADLSGNGPRELIYAVVVKEKSSFKNGESYIVRQPISKSLLK